jgi:23S rRNA pseudouridine1911/1915/1917 synthase
VSAPGRLAATVAAAEAGRRLDRWLAGRWPDVSRTRLRALIERGQVRVDGRAAKPALRLRAGQRVEAERPEPPPADLAPEPGPLAVVHEDEHVLVVDKPAGVVTHPGAGRRQGTLAAAALAHAPGMAGVGGPGRPGIVHRLDKGTSGLLVLAKTPAAYDGLVAQLARRQVSRRYLALVHGRPARAEGTIDAPIGRDPRARTRMAVAGPGRGKRAVTHYRVLQRLEGASLVECRLETGRTHQIRVHLAALGHPVLGDRTYGGRRRPALGEAVERLVADLDGLALHAAGLGFDHPVTGARIECGAPLPPRIGRLLLALGGTPP